MNNLDNFDEKIRQAMNTSKEMPRVVRQSLDEVYSEIENGIQKKSTKKTKSKHINYFFLFSAAICIFSVIVFSAPIGNALRNFLNFDQFTSEKLVQSNFVQSQDYFVEDQGIIMRLNEIYFDQNEIGLSLSAELSEKSKLLKDKYNQYVINFAILDKQDHVLFDFNSGLTEKDYLPKIKGNYIENSRIDKNNHTIDFTVTQTLENTDLRKELQQAKVIVTKISTSVGGSTKNSDSDFHTEKVREDFVQETGRWELPIQNETKQAMPSLRMEAENTDLQSDIFAKVTPTTLVLNLKIGDDAKITEKTAEIILSNDSNGKNSYKQKNGKRVILNGQEYYQATYSYPEYDVYHSVFVHIGDTTIELTLK